MARYVDVPAVVCTAGYAVACDVGSNAVCGVVCDVACDAGSDVDSNQELLSGYGLHIENLREILSSEHHMKNRIDIRNVITTNIASDIAAGIRDDNAQDSTNDNT